ncbi:hypothetical protein P7K49_009931 [Saguinus oedipus]|uniref:Uncharacterized protein n=1 Tax=Saguinus oedipus TaxID=9490 RepID=A0ABQ9VLX2_SAGOE|nr:hypothetical protein P7K49_009931 [Saguinus oedipus]
MEKSALVAVGAVRNMTDSRDSREVGRTKQPETSTLQAAAAFLMVSDLNHVCDLHELWSLLTSAWTSTGRLEGVGQQGLQEPGTEALPNAKEMSLLTCHSLQQLRTCWFHADP